MRLAWISRTLFNDLDDVGDPVGADELAGVLRHVGGLDGVHLPGAGLSAPDGEDAAPGADIKNHLTDPSNQSSRSQEDIYIDQ